MDTGAKPSGMVGEAPITQAPLTALLGLVDETQTMVGRTTAMVQERIDAYSNCGGCHDDQGAEVEAEAPNRIDAATQSLYRIQEDVRRIERLVDTLL